MFTAALAAGADFWQPKWKLKDEARDQAIESTCLLGSDARGFRGAGHLSCLLLSLWHFGTLQSRNRPTLCGSYYGLGFVFWLKLITISVTAAGSCRASADLLDWDEATVEDGKICRQSAQCIQIESLP